MASEPYDTKGHYRMANTLSHHLVAAHTFLSSYMSTDFPLYTHDGPTPRMVPFLAAMLDL